MATASGLIPLKLMFLVSFQKGRKRCMKSRLCLISCYINCFMVWFILFVDKLKVVSVRSKFISEFISVNSYWYCLNIA